MKKEIGQNPCTLGMNTAYRETVSNCKAGELNTLPWCGTDLTNDQGETD